MKYTPVDFTVNRELVDSIMQLYKYKALTTKREFDIAASNLFDQFLAQEQHKLLVSKGIIEEQMLEFSRIAVQTLSPELLNMLIEEVQLAHIDALT